MLHESGTGGAPSRSDLSFENGVYGVLSRGHCFFVHWHAPEALKKDPGLLAGQHEPGDLPKV